MFLKRNELFTCLIALSVSLILITGVRECASNQGDDPIATAGAASANAEGSSISDATSDMDEVSQELPEGNRPLDDREEETARRKATKEEKAAERILKAKMLFADIDADGDENVTREEVQLWVERTERKAVEDQRNAEWQAFNTDGDYEVTWEEYKTGALQRAGVPLDDDENKKIVTEMIALEWGRFEAADRDKNGTLSKAEFKATIFPHEHQYMVDQMVKEMLKEVDKNSDELISVEEYQGMFAELMGAQEQGVMRAFEDQIQQYHKDHDTNGDGVLDAVEMRPMVTEDRSNHSVEETDRLLLITDTDQNGILESKEFIAKYGDFRMFLRNVEYNPFPLDGEDDYDEEEEEDDEEEEEEEGFPDDFGLDDPDDPFTKDAFDFNEEEILKELERDEL